MRRICASYGRGSVSAMHESIKGARILYLSEVPLLGIKKKQDSIHWQCCDDFQPQNSIPDIIIWMIKAERERVAYCRIPANELLFREDESERGEKCGKTIDVNLKVCDMNGIFCHWKRPFTTHLFHVHACLSCTHNTTH